MLRVVALDRAEEHLAGSDRPVPFDVVVLAHDERHLRRKVLALSKGEKVLIDLPEPAQLRGGDLLVLEDGRHAGIEAAAEELLEIRPRDTLHLAELCWHIGNRHLAARIETGRILILRDHVIRSMLEGLGAELRDVTEPFEPLRGAYSGHGHTHGHKESHTHGHEESHAHGDGEARSHGHAHGHG